MNYIYDDNGSFNKSSRFDLFYSRKYKHVLIFLDDDYEKFFETKYSDELSTEVIFWLDENIGHHNWILSHSMMILFKLKEDALAFRLRWE